jgi:hypothetical protein
VTQVVVAVIALFGTLLTVVVTATATALKVRQDLQREYDLALRRERMDAYRALWKELEPLAKYFRNTRATYGTMKSVGKALRRWYFETGGIFLTVPARDAYFALLDELRLVEGVAPGDPEDELELAVFERLRELGSALRTVMVEDVLTRRGSALRAG